jgi:hypothetical protein
MDRLALWVVLLPEISEVLVSSAVLDIRDIVVLSKEERAVGSCENLAQPVLLIHWNLSSVAPCLIWRIY